MAVIQDPEFGKITVRRSASARHVSVRVAPDGTLRASLPIYAPTLLVKHLLKNSREELRKIIAKSKPGYRYENGMQIGKSHTLIIRYSETNKSNVSKHGLQIIVTIPTSKTVEDPIINREIRDAVIAALRTEAKSYLPKRLSFLAEKHSYTYSKTRFSHSSSRWGSCNSNGTISLNIALMKLPFELIDYVIIHELSHTKQMNHGPLFWALVASVDPNYKIHRRELRSQNPSI